MNVTGTCKAWQDMGQFMLMSGHEFNSSVLVNQVVEPSALLCLSYSLSFP